MGKIMNSALLRNGLLALKISFWGGITYGTILPAYRVAQGLEEMRQLIQSVRQDQEARTDEYRAHRFDGILRYADGKEKEGEQKAIRQFRRSIEAMVGEDCGTVDSEQYELPKIEQLKKGRYELQMECKGKTLVLHAGKMELR